MGLLVTPLTVSEDMVDMEMITAIEKQEIGQIFNEIFNLSVTYIKMDSIRSYTAKNAAGEDMLIDFFAQLIYENARDIYCSVLRMSFEEISFSFVCVYKFSPDKRGGTIYSVGKPAKGCKIGRNPDMKGLCCRNEKGNVQRKMSPVY